MSEVKPKTVLITGASSGFGQATAKMLAKKGHKLILIARRKDRLDELKKTLKTDVYTAAVDVGSRAQVLEFFSKLPKKLSSIDVLINNAGLATGREPAQDFDADEWDRMIDTNIKGTLHVTRPVLDIMKQRSEGLIVNIGSCSAFLPYKGGNVYGGTKAFVRQFSRNLRTDLFGTGVKVTTIEPGAAETEFSIVRFGDEQVAKEYYQGWNPLKAEDVASAIVWVINQPPHVNIDNIEIMPLDQTYGGSILNKKDLA